MAENRRAVSAATDAFRTWQDGVAAIFGCYNRQAARVGASAWGARLDPTQIRESVRRITDETREVTYAQVAVASEWLRAPFWLTGTVSPSALPNSYGRLFQAYNRLFAAYVEAAQPLRQAADEVVTTATKAAEKQLETTRDAANEVAKANAEVTKAAVNTAVKATAEATRGVGSAVDQAIEVAENAAHRAASQQNGTKLFHVVKGKIARSGEKIYHVFGQANYDRFDADIEFESEEAAQAAGFRPAQR